MIIPRFKDDYKDKTKEEIIVERQNIINEIMRIENEELLPQPESSKKEKTKIKMIMDPAPEVVWKVLNHDLIMLTQLIEEKSSTFKI